MSVSFIALVFFFFAYSRDDERVTDRLGCDASKVRMA